MRNLGIIGLVALSSMTGPVWADESQNAARSVLYGVIVAAPDTPGAIGYLALAGAEADIARRHLDRALASGNNPIRLRQEVAQALYAVDPHYGDVGEGLGYGLRPALSKVVQGMGRIALLKPGDDRAEEVGAAIAAAGTRVNEAVDFGRAALVSPSHDVASHAARAMLLALDRAVDGCSRADGGRIDWRHDEPGLLQAEETAESLAGDLAVR